MPARPRAALQTSPRALTASSRTAPKPPARVWERPADGSPSIFPGSPEPADDPPGIFPGSPEPADGSPSIFPGSPEPADGPPGIFRGPPGPADDPLSIFRGSPEAADGPPDVFCDGPEPADDRPANQGWHKPTAVEPLAKRCWPRFTRHAFEQPFVRDPTHGDRRWCGPAGLESGQSPAVRKRLALRVGAPWSVVEATSRLTLIRAAIKRNHRVSIRWLSNPPFQAGPRLSPVAASSTWSCQGVDAD
jgi:hypothetical protein